MLRNQGSSLLPRMMSVANPGRKCDLERFCWERGVSNAEGPKPVVAGTPVVLACKSWQPLDRHVSTQAGAVSERGTGRVCTVGETGRSGLIPELWAGHPKTRRQQGFSQCHPAFAPLQVFIFLFLIGLYLFFRAVLSVATRLRKCRDFHILPALLAPALRGTISAVDEPTLPHHCHLQAMVCLSAQLVLHAFASGQRSGGVYPSVYYCLEQSHCPESSGLPLHPSFTSNSGNRWCLDCLHGFALSRTSHSWKHTTVVREAARLTLHLETGVGVSHASSRNSP